MFDKGLTLGRFLKFCIAEVSPIIFMTVIVATVVGFVQTISAFLSMAVSIVGIFFACYLCLKWLEYSINNKKIQDWIER